MNAARVTCAYNPDSVDLMEVADQLAEDAIGKGDMIAVSGRLTKSAWTGKDGADRSGFSVLADTIASARTVRPGKPKAEIRRSAVAANGDGGRRSTIGWGFEPPLAGGIEHGGAVLSPPCRRS